MATVHPAQRLLLSAIATALSTSAAIDNAKTLPAIDPAFNPSGSALARVRHQKQRGKP